MVQGNNAIVTLEVSNFKSSKRKYERYSSKFIIKYARRSNVTKEIKTI